MFINNINYIELMLKVEQNYLAESVFILWNLGQIGIFLFNFFLSYFSNFILFKNITATLNWNMVKIYNINFCILKNSFTVGNSNIWCETYNIVFHIICKIQTQSRGKNSCWGQKQSKWMIYISSFSSQVPCLPHFSF